MAPFLRSLALKREGVHFLCNARANPVTLSVTTSNSASSISVASSPSPSSTSNLTKIAASALSCTTSVAISSLSETSSMVQRLQSTQAPSTPFSVSPSASAVSKSDTSTPVSASTTITLVSSTDSFISAPMIVAIPTVIASEDPMTPVSISVTIGTEDSTTEPPSTSQTPETSTILKEAKVSTTARTTSDNVLVPSVIISEDPTSTSMKASSTSGASKATTGTSFNSPSTTSCNASTTTGGWLIPTAGIPITSGSITSGGGFTPSGFKPDTTRVSPTMSSTKSFPSMGSVNEPSAPPPFSLSASASTMSGIATSSSADEAPPTAPSITPGNSTRSGSGNGANNNSNSPLSLELWVDPMKSDGAGSHGTSYAQSSTGKDGAINKRAVGQTGGMASSSDASMSVTISSTRAALDRRALQSSATTVTSTFTGIQVSTIAVATISSDGKPVSTQISASTSTGVFTTTFATTFATPLMAPAPTTAVSSAFNGNPAIGGIIGGVLAPLIVLGLVIFLLRIRARRCRAVQMAFTSMNSEGETEKPPSDSTTTALAGISSQSLTMPWPSMGSVVGTSRGFPPMPTSAPHTGDSHSNSVTGMDEDVETRANSSLVVQASTQSGSSALERVADVSNPAQRESNNGPVISQKLLRELARLRGRNGGRNDNERTETDAAAIEEPISGHGLERRREQRHETDGGVRLGGGRPGEAVLDDLDQDSMSEGSTLPPPYSSHFGDT